MTATKRQTAIAEAKWAKAREHWVETRPAQQSLFLDKCAEDVERVEHAIVEAQTLGDRLAEFGGLVVRYGIATASEATVREQAQAPWLEWEIARRAGHIHADVLHATAEAAEAHTHYVKAGQAARRFESLYLRAQDEIAALKARLDQAEAALRDREATP